MCADQSSNRDIFTISRLNNEVRAVLEGSFPLLWVEGEISNLATPRSGHLYFSLKDAHAQVRCALFKSKRQLLRFAPSNGDQVLARARIGFYEPRGDFQLIIEHLEPAGAGSAQREFEALKAKLQAEGLFDSERKRDLPAFPRCLGVITSPSGAAIRDVLNVIRRRAPHLRVIVYPAQVQGQSAPGELHDALQLALARAECDVLLLTRGGGSIEDLAAFNDERLARAIVAADIPIVSAVGHEIDVTISDFVADRRAPTPSAAAELISPDTDALQLTIDKQRRRIIGALRRHLQADRRHLDILSGRLSRAAPANRLRQQQQRLDSLDLRLSRAMRSQLARKAKDVDLLSRQLLSHSPTRRLQLLNEHFQPLAERLQQAWRHSYTNRRTALLATTRQLNAVSPLATMQRGFAVLRKDDKSVVSHVEQVEIGDAVEALLADGRLNLQVERISSESIFQPVDEPSDS